MKEETLDASVALSTSSRLSKHSASDCLKIPFRKPSVSRRAVRGPRLCLRPRPPPQQHQSPHLVSSRSLQRARECRTPAPASTPRPRACPCGRAESSTTCELQRLWSARPAQITHHQDVTSSYCSFAGTKGRIKCSRTFVTGRSANRRCPGEVRVGSDTLNTT